MKFISNTIFFKEKISKEALKLHNILNRITVVEITFPKVQFIRGRHH